jgi:CspA family cold shock protein
VRVTLDPQKPLVLDRFLDAPELGVFAMHDMGATIALGVVRELHGVDRGSVTPADATSDESTGDDDLVDGVVDFFNDTGGYGFVETDAVDEDVFFHLEDVGPSTIAEGDAVRLTIEQHDKGPRASRLIVVDGNGDEGETANGSHERVTGTVDFFNDTGGYGFIVSDAVDEDVFFHMEDIDGPDLQEGQEVTFRVVRTDNGPRAIDVERLAGGNRNSASDDTASDEATGGSSQGRVTGTVDFFNDTGGYGFIVSDAVDEDVFFHMEDIGGPDLEEGQEVQFRVEEYDKGPRATDLVRL